MKETILGFIISREGIEAVQCIDLTDTLTEEQSLSVNAEAFAESDGITREKKEALVVTHMAIAEWMTETPENARFKLLDMCLKHVVKSLDKTTDEILKHLGIVAGTTMRVLYPELNVSEKMHMTKEYRNRATTLGLTLAKKQLEMELDK
jgi:uncharacterized FlaG/YvyC family protein